MDQTAKVIILTGPCGVGKTTIANLISKELEITLVDGDNIKKRYFPNVDFITEEPEKLNFVKEEIFQMSKRHFISNKSVLIDYVILGSEYLERFKKQFKNDLHIFILLPPRQIIYERDKDRACWTSGREMIDQLYDKYQDLKIEIGSENYIDTSNETPEESSKLIVKTLKNRNVL